MILPRAVSAAVAPKKPKKGDVNDKINIGFIGLGQQAIHLLSGFITIPEVRVIAGCDVYDIKRDRFVNRVNKYYGEQGIKNKVDMYIKFEDLLARPDIDAVVIATPDHQHARIAIAACKAGKDIYLEKPLTFTIYEGQRLIEAVRANNRILQVGSMQRSMAEFIHAANIVREGRLGKISLIHAYVGEGPKPYTLPKQEVPAGLDWDLWLGPLADTWHYNHELNPLITANGGDECWGAWRWYQGLGGGFTTDWGAHMFDIAQWCLGKDGSGPVENSAALGQPAPLPDLPLRQRRGDDTERFRLRTSREDSGRERMDHRTPRRIQRVVARPHAERCGSKGRLRDQRTPLPELREQHPFASRSERTRRGGPQFVHGMHLG